MFVAVLDNQIVGFGYVEKFNDDTAEVCGLFVSPVAICSERHREFAATVLGGESYGRWPSKREI